MGRFLDEAKASFCMICINIHLAYCRKCNAREKEKMEDEKWKMKNS